MSGKVIAGGLVVFTIIFAAALWYAQYYAYYREVRGITEIEVAGRQVAVSGYQGIEASSSALKLRGCFMVDPADFDGLPVAAAPTPLTPPDWFSCYNVAALTEDLAAGRATAYLAKANDRDGLDRIVAVYPDGRAYMWRQLNDKYQE